MPREIENTVVINNQELTYVIVYKKIKNIYFRVKNDMKIYVSCNRLVSNVQIRKLLEDNAAAILQLYQHAQRKKTDALYYLGNKLEFIMSDKKLYIENNIIYGPHKEACQKYIYSLSLPVFEARLKQIKAQFKNLPNFTLKVRKMTSKWGVCNKKSMTITLNAELITKEVHLIDYVIIHELCHFKYMDHSKAYWVYVASFYPYYKQARKELKY